MSKLTRIGFTLVELLVVIAIVGILSGLIIVGMSSSVKSANTAKGQIFASSIRDSLLNHLVSEWKLDQVAANVTPDSWSSNNCTLTGAGGLPVLQTSGCIYNGCISFDGVDDYLDCGSPSALNISGAKTISVWVKFNTFPSVAGRGQGIVINKNYWVLVYAKGYGVVFQDKNTTTRLNSGEILNLNAWYNIVATSADSNYANQKLYIDGTNIAGNYQYTFGGPTLANLVIGYKAADPDDFLNGLIDDVRIYDSVIPTSQIKEQYYAGVNRLFTKGEFSKDDYRKMIAELTSTIDKR